MAHGSWFARRAVLPPAVYLEMGTLLPLTPPGTGAVTRSKRVCISLMSVGSLLCGFRVGIDTGCGVYGGARSGVNAYPASRSSRRDCVGVVTEARANGTIGR